MSRLQSLLLLVVLSLPTAGCLYVKVDVTVTVQKELDDFFGDLDKKSTTVGAKP